MSRRPARVAEAIRDELSDIIKRRVKDPRVGFASLINVEVTGDLKQVRAYVSVLGDEAEKEKTMRALDSATGFIRSELGGRLSLRHVPELYFMLDSSIEHGEHINRLLRGLKEDE